MMRKHSFVLIRNGGIMEKKYLVPSFEIESKTHSFNIGIWAITGFASFFIFWFVVMILPAMFSHGVLDLLGNVTFNWLYFSATGALITVIITIYFSIVALNRLLVSYKFEGYRIVKGRIKRAFYIDKNIEKLKENVGMDLKKTVWSSNWDPNQKIMTTHTIDNWSKIIQMIHCNMNQQFVEIFFDGDCYKKREYLNPILIKETSKKMIYKCDNKKLVIYKMYSNMDIEIPFKKTKSFVKRLIKALVLTFVLALFVSMTVIYRDYLDTQNYIAKIEPIKKQQISEIKNNLEKYGYNLNDYDETFTKKDSVSSNFKVKYIFSTYTGEIEDIDLYLRIPLNYDQVYDEFDDIMKPIISKFDQKNINDFKDGITAIIQGDFAYEVLYSTNEEIAIRLKKSDGKIYIYTN